MLYSFEEERVDSLLRFVYLHPPPQLLKNVCASTLARNNTINSNGSHFKHTDSKLFVLHNNTHPARSEELLIYSQQLERAVLCLEEGEVDIKL